MSTLPEGLKSIDGKESIVHQLFDVKTTMEFRCLFCDYEREGPSQILNLLPLALPEGVFSIAGAIEKVNIDQMSVRLIFTFFFFMSMKHGNRLMITIGSAHGMFFIQTIQKTKLNHLKLLYKF